MKNAACPFERAIAHRRLWPHRNLSRSAESALGRGPDDSLLSEILISEHFPTLITFGISPLIASLLEFLAPFSTSKISKFDSLLKLCFRYLKIIICYHLATSKLEKRTTKYLQISLIIFASKKPLILNFYPFIFFFRL